MKQSISALKKESLQGKRIFLRVDFNVPIQNGEISDNTRIREALPTIKYLIENEAKIIIGSHLGRPKGEKNATFSLKPIAEELEKQLKHPVKFSNDSYSKSNETEVSNLNNGEILLLENLRFYNEETENDDNLSRFLAGLADIYVNDSFGTAHRAHSSTEGVGKFIPGYLGLLFEKEVTALNQVLETPKRPLMAIIGGAKVSTKINVIENLIDKVDTLVIGGGMTYTFLKAQGYEIGKSLCEDDYLEKANQILEKIEKSNCKLILPLDHTVVKEFNENAKIKIVDTDSIEKDDIGVDIGQKTIELIKNEIPKDGTIVWNGPLGVFEMMPFSKGTFAIAETIAHNDSMTIVGGGDSVSAINKSGLANHISHISTGGGASLEFLEGKTLPGYAVLQD